MYAIPADDRPRMIDWEAGTDHAAAPAEVQWWQPAVVPYGGKDSTVVIDSKGEMSVFHGTALAGVAPAPYQAKGPTEPEFWPISEGFGNVHAGVTFAGTPAAASHHIRDTGYMVAAVDNVLGLASVRALTWNTRWQLADACTLLKVYPPLGLNFEGDPAEFEDGVQQLGERGARRVKRALVDRLSAERRVLRALSEKLETHWR